MTKENTKEGSKDIANWDGINEIEIKLNDDL